MHERRCVPANGKREVQLFPRSKMLPANSLSCFRESGVRQPLERQVRAMAVQTDGKFLMDFEGCQNFVRITTDAPEMSNVEGSRVNRKQGAVRGFGQDDQDSSGAI